MRRKTGFAEVVAIRTWPSTLVILSAICRLIEICSTEWRDLAQKAIYKEHDNRHLDRATGNIGAIFT